MISVPQSVSFDKLGSSTIVTPIDEVWAMIGQVNQERALTDLRKLTGEEPICLDNDCYTITNREVGSPGLQWAKDYVYDELDKIGYTVEIQDWSTPDYEDQNLIIRKPGLIYPDEEIYFIAHLDGQPDISAADDNASGVVSLLEMARIIKQRVFYYTLVLLITTGEEPGYLSAQYYVDHLNQDQLDAIMYVLNVDMIGYDANQDRVMELYSGDQPLDFVQLLSDIIFTYQINLQPQIMPGCA
jgi:acetylornithine deacetylase/succinyl-diaminopimelate desuccinylase-like protein